VIISHKHKFIYIKARKVASTSVGCLLTQHCGENDILGQDCGSATIMPVHAEVERVKLVAGIKAWREYFKFSIVRNPWDVVVSEFWHRKWTSKISEKMMPPSEMFLPFDDLVKWIIKARPLGMNYKYYFDSKGRPALDYYIRYENLDIGYQKVCERIGIPFEKLPRLRGHTRKDKRHYSTYYNDRTRKAIGQVHKKMINFFGYEFKKQEALNDNITQI